MIDALTDVLNGFMSVKASVTDMRPDLVRILSGGWVIGPLAGVVIG